MATAEVAVQNMAVEKELHPMLKNGTKERHAQAENCTFVKMIMKRRVSKELYQVFASSLYYIYQALEEAGEQNKDHPVYGPTYFPTELSRKAALEKDLEYYYGPDWKQKIECTKETTNYVNRIRHIGHVDPALLVPHAYARYLGDLSGGQILKSRIVKGLSLPSTGEGVKFYDFPEIDDIKKFKQFYTGRLNSIDANRELSDRLEEEARNAFLLNINLFEELDSIAQNIPNGYLPDPKESARSENDDNTQAPTNQGGLWSFLSKLKS